MNQASTLPRIGDLVDGKFRIDRKLGEGGTSTVYEVSHVITDKKFAIKWLLPELALDDDAVDRFIHEARVGGRFVHPHAVQIYDICRANNSFYMLLDLLEGESLEARLERVGRFSVGAACAIVLQCADILAAAHEAGIVHRDLKPANIFLCAGAGRAESPRILDFGISKFCAELQNLSLVKTARGSVIGTPLYMSPEQMLGEPTSPRTDIYALGAVLYELVSGRPPFHADSYPDLVIKVAVEGRAQPLDQVAQVDPEFAAIVARAMAQSADDRFASVDEFARALMPYAPRTVGAAYRVSRADITPIAVARAPEREPRAAPIEALIPPEPAPAKRSARAVVSGVLAACAALGIGWVVTSREPKPAVSHVRPRASAPIVQLPEPALAEHASPDAHVFARSEPAPQPRQVEGRRHKPERASEKPRQAREVERAAQPRSEMLAVRPLGPRAEVSEGTREKVPSARGPVPAEPTRTDRNLAERPAEIKATAEPKPARMPLPKVNIARSDFEYPQPSAAPPRAEVTRRDF